MSVNINDTLRRIAYMNYVGIDLEGRAVCFSLNQMDVGMFRPWVIVPVERLRPQFQ